MRQENLHRDSDKNVWINPTGGLGDILMLSGVLYKYHCRYPAKKFNLVRRAIYTNLLKGHPCIDQVGYPPMDAKIILTDYWAKEKLGNGQQRPYQILARTVGLKTPIQEDLYLSGEMEKNEHLSSFIPFGEQKVIMIAPTSSSPRKIMDPGRWSILVSRLIEKGYFVVQLGRSNDTYLKSSYSLLGLTTPRELIGFVNKADAVLTADNFIMHATHLAGTPAVVLWGPTDSEVYGYPGQFHLSGTKEHCELKEKCLGAAYPENYPTACPLGRDHCLNKIDINQILEHTESALSINKTNMINHERKAELQASEKVER